MEIPFNLDFLAGAAIGTCIILYLAAPLIPAGRHNMVTWRTGLWIGIVLAILAILLVPEFHIVLPSRLP